MTILGNKATYIIKCALKGNQPTYIALHRAVAFSRYCKCIYSNVLCGKIFIRQTMSYKNNNPCTANCFSALTTEFIGLPPLPNPYNHRQNTILPIYIWDGCKYMLAFTMHRIRGRPFIGWINSISPPSNMLLAVVFTSVRFDQLSVLMTKQIRYIRKVRKILLRSGWELHPIIIWDAQTLIWVRDLKASCTQILGLHIKTLVSHSTFGNFNRNGLPWSNVKYFHSKTNFFTIFTQVTRVELFCEFK